MKEQEVLEAIASGSFIRERAKYGQRYLLPVELTVTQYERYERRGGAKAVKCEVWNIYDGTASRQTWGNPHKTILLGQLEGLSYGRNTAGEYVTVTTENIADIAREKVLQTERDEVARKNARQYRTDMTELLTRLLGEQVWEHEVDKVLSTNLGKKLIAKVIAQASLTTGGE